MANKKISQLTAKGARLAATDLVEISESDGVGGYVTKSVTGANITGGQIIAAVSNTLGTTITGATIAMSDSVLIPAGTFSSNCQIDLSWIPSRLTGATGTMQGLIYINSTASLTGATLMGTSANMTTASLVTNNRCTRWIAVRSNVATLVLTSALASSDFSPLTPTENLPFNNSSDIYIIFAINNVSGVTTGRNVGYRIVGYNL